MTTFFEKLDARWDRGGRVCVGLDSDRKKLPKIGIGIQDPLLISDDDRVFEFNRRIINATHKAVLCYKPNIAFYAADGDGKNTYKALEKTIQHIREIAPEVPIILDSKRGDIANTNIGYVHEAFRSFDADAVTVHPYLGREAMKPFLDQKDKGIIVLCRTSNPGAGEFQDLTIAPTTRGTLPRPLYQIVAQHVAQDWNTNGNCALVVGATYPVELKAVRDIVGEDLWILLPGIGTQGGDLEGSLRAGLNKKKRGLIINSSSGIIFASKEMDFAEVAARKLAELTQQMNRIIASL